MPFIYIWGSPLDFSLSPFFQEHAAILSGNRIIYQIFRGDQEQFKSKLSADSCLGANITIPFKIRAVALCDELTENAKSAGSVNTIFKQKGKLIGDNTDGRGLLMRLKSKAFCNENIAILGNGGSAKSIAAALAEERRNLTIFGRAEKGWEKKFGKFVPLSRWREDLYSINTLPFEVKGKNVVNISYRFGKIGLDAQMTLAFQGWLAARRWFGERTVSCDKFVSIVREHAKAQSNLALIFNLAGERDEIQQIS